MLDVSKRLTTRDQFTWVAEMYRFCPHHLPSIVKMQKEICIGAAFTTNKWRQLLATASDLTEIKLRPATSTGDWWNSSTRRMTPHKHLQKYGIRHHLLCLLLLQGVHILNDHHIYHKTESSYKLFIWHSTLSNINGAAGDGEQKTEVRSIKGSVWCGCASGVVGTLWEEGHPVNETYTTKNTDSQWSSDGHFTKSCESHTPAGHTILSPSLSLPLAQSIEPSPVLQGFSM